MAETIGDVAVRIGADTSGLTRGLNDADRSLQSFGAKAALAAGKVAALSAAAAVAATGVAALIKSQIDLAAAAADAAQKAGVSVEEWSKLSYAFKFGTKEGADLGQTLLFLNKAIAGAGAGVKGNVEDFRALGVAYKNTDGSMRSASEVLDDIADAFAKLPDGANKAALATQFFGKSGADIIPFLNQGSEGIRKFKEEAERLGLVISQDTAAAADQFNDNLDRLTANITGAARGLTAELLPSLVELTDGMLESGGLVDDLRDSMDEVKAVAEVMAAVLAGRLVSSIAASGLAFAAAQLEALRYQAALARMAGTSGVASAAMAGITGAGRSLLGIMGGPVGLAVAVSAVGLSFVDFSESATAASMSAKEFDERLASLTGNTEKLREAQKNLKLDELMNDMRAVSDEIAAINREAELSNAKLGKGEIERIQMLQGRLAELAKAYQEVANQKLGAAAPVAQSPDVATESEEGKDSDAVERARKEAEKLAKIEEEKRIKAAEEAALAREQVVADYGARLMDLQNSLLTEKEVLTKAFEEKRNQILAANELGVGDKVANMSLLQDLENQHQAEITKIDEEAAKKRKEQQQAELDAKLSDMQQVFGGISTLMNSESRKQFELGKAAALAGAGINAYRAISGAYAVGSEIGGPPLAVAFAGAAAAAQFATLSNIRKQQFRGGGGGSAAGGGSVTGAINDYNTPVSPTGNAPTQRTNITLVGDVFSREAVIGLLQQSMRDGYTLS